MRGPGSLWSPDSTAEGRPFRAPRAPLRLQQPDHPFSTNPSRQVRRVHGIGGSIALGAFLRKTSVPVHQVSSTGALVVHLGGWKARQRTEPAPALAVAGVA